MAAYVTGEREALDLLNMLTETLDSVSDLAERARLLARVREVANHDFDLRLYRMVHELTTEHGWKRREVADALSLSVPTVREYLRRYRDHLGVPRADRAERERIFADGIYLAGGT